MEQKHTKSRWKGMTMMIEIKKKIIRRIQVVWLEVTNLELEREKKNGSVSFSFLFVSLF